jgi:hypothetical protein
MKDNLKAARTGHNVVCSFLVKGLAFESIQFAERNLLLIMACPGKPIEPLWLFN